MSYNTIIDLTTSVDRARTPCVSNSVDGGTEENVVIDLYSDEYETIRDKKKVYRVEITGPPRPMPGPTLMAWLSEGKLMRRVINKARPKMLQLRSSVKHYLESKYQIKNSDFPLFRDGPVSVSIVFHRKKSRTRKLLSGIPVPDTNKPDIDNLSKLVLDALESVVYNNDKQVSRLLLQKIVNGTEHLMGRTSIEFSRLLQWEVEC